MRARKLQINPQADRCLFCKLFLNPSAIIYQTHNFYLISDGAPLEKGHLLLIPKRHFACYAALQKDLVQEYLELKNKILTFLQKNFGRVIIFEHGVAGQTIFHAHLHFLPTKTKVLPFIEKERDAKKIKDFSSLQTEYQNNHQYLFFEEDNSQYIIDSKNTPPGYFHIYLLPKVLNVSKNHKIRAKKSQEVFEEAKKLWQQ